MLWTWCSCCCGCGWVSGYAGSAEGYCGACGSNTVLICYFILTAFDSSTAFFLKLQLTSILSNALEARVKQYNTYDSLRLGPVRHVAMQAEHVWPPWSITCPAHSPRNHRSACKPAETTKGVHTPHHAAHEEQKRRTGKARCMKVAVAIYCLHGSSSVTVLPAARKAKHITQKRLQIAIERRINIESVSDTCFAIHNTLCSIVLPDCK